MGARSFARRSNALARQALRDRAVRVGVAWSRNGRMAEQELPSTRISRLSTVRVVSSPTYFFSSFITYTISLATSRAFVPLYRLPSSRPHTLCIELLINKSTALLCFFLSFLHSCKILGACRKTQLILHIHTLPLPYLEALSLRYLILDNINNNYNNNYNNHNNSTLVISISAPLSHNYLSLISINIIIETAVAHVYFFF